MQKISVSKNYTHVADIYEHLMRKVRYDYWADYIYALASNYITEKATALEISSGNCKLARFLSAYYSKLIATDLSFDMLVKYPSNIKNKICCDMLRLPFKTKFDLLISAFDSVNYLTTKRKLAEFMQEVHNRISDGGIFTFDASLEPNSYKHIKHPIRKGSYKNLNYHQKSEYDPLKKIHKNIFLIQYPNGNVYKEVHIQRVYAFEEYFKIIEDAGLSVKECYESFTFKDGSPKSPRVQFVVVKR
ncbi:MAG: class I SAM-dependent methyltransferase [Ignavibacteriaceae bacterium]|nr:class I SAM-dependent methyltransferase [Ignavibacteriaceae bacterium]